MIVSGTITNNKSASELTSRSQREHGDLLAFSSGVVGGTLMTVLFGLGRGFRRTLMNLELLVGGWITGGTTILTWLLGLMVFLFLCGLIGWCYGLAFYYMRRSGWLLGLMLSLAQWLISGLLLGLIATVHPLVPGWISAPGFFANQHGTFTVLLFLLANLLFGAVVGELYRRGQTSEAEERRLRSLIE